MYCCRHLSDKQRNAFHPMLVFLGIGCAWLIASIKHAVGGTQFRVTPGSLGFSVVIFCSLAVTCIALLVFRRRPSIGGELGGPQKSRIITSVFLLLLWFTYVLLSSLETYCIIPGF